MPDYKTLKPGDRIGIIAIPKPDLEQMAQRMREGKPDAQATVRILQRLRDRKKILRIDHIDEYGYPWFDVEFRNKKGTWEHHSLAVMDNASWDFS